MMRSLMSAVLALTLAVTALAAPAESAPIDDIHACWAMTATARRCYDNVAVATEAGGRVDLRVRVSPAHAGQMINLVRIRPPSNRWVHFRTLTLSPTGRAHYLWQTQASDIRQRDYQFQFRVPGHGSRSNIVKVAVIGCVEC